MLTQGCVSSSCGVFVRVQRQSERLRDSEDGSAPTLNMEKTAEILEMSALIEAKTQVRGWCASTPLLRFPCPHIVEAVRPQVCVWGGGPLSCGGCWMPWR